MGGAPPRPTSGKDSAQGGSGDQGAKSSQGQEEAQNLSPSGPRGQPRKNSPVLSGPNGPAVQGEDGVGASEPCERPPPHHAQQSCWRFLCTH